MKVTFCTIEVVFEDLFSRDLESLFVEKDTVTTGFNIEDQDIVKHKSAMMEDTKCPALFNIGCQAEVIIYPFFRDLEGLFLKKNAVSTGFKIKDQDTIKHESAIIKDTKCLALFNISCQVEVIMNPFRRDLESLSLQKNTVSARFTIEDQNTLKHESIMMEDTKWPTLFNLSCLAKVTIDSFPRDLES